MNDSLYIKSKANITRLFPLEINVNGKNIFITGINGFIGGNLAKSLIEQNSGKIISNVNKKLDYLIVGEKPTTGKIDNAKNLKINIISENMLLKMLDKTS